LANDIQTNPGPIQTTRSVPLKQRHLKCVSLNAQSLKSFVKTPYDHFKTCKLVLFQNFVYPEDYDIVAVTETWPNDNILDSEILSHGYSIYCQDRNSSKRGGSVLLAVKQSIESIR
jgi:hypothetical protein